MSQTAAHGTVLVLDSDPGIAELAARFVERETELTATATTDPGAAVAAAESGEVDALVTEYVLTEGDGLVVLEQVRSAAPTLPVVLHTEHGSEELVAAAITAGVSDYLRKELSTDYFRHLAARVAAALDRPTSAWRDPAASSPRTVERGQGRTETVYDRVTDAILAFDDEWHFTYVNARGEELFDRPRDELLGRRLWEVVPTLAETNIGARLRAAMVTQTVQTVREYLDSFGIWFEARVFPGPDGVSVYLRDISEEFAARRSLAAEHRLVEAAVDALDDVFFVCDAQQTLVRWNARLQSVTGYTETELEGMSPATLVAEDDREALEQSLDAAGVDGTTTVEARLLTKDDELIPYEFRLVRLTDEDGESLGRVGVGRDQSARQQRERELERQNERLEEFASVVSHDLRNPLSIASAFTEEARETGDVDQLDRVTEALDRMDVLISNLLSLAQQGQSIGDPVPVDLAATARRAWAAVRTPDATLDIEEDLPEVEGDPQRLTQAFENLFRNSVEHGGNDVTVRVAATPTGFLVEDDGPGIPDGRDGEVFERGYSTLDGGTGFGLAIVREIVEAHGWEISTADGDAGARFEISLTPHDTVVRPRHERSG